MPDIEKFLFSGQENIFHAEWATLTIPDMSNANVSEFLEGSGWDGNVPAGVMGLQLAADKSRPTAARFALAGHWSDRPNRIQGSWGEGGGGDGDGKGRQGDGQDWVRSGPAIVPWIRTGGPKNIRIRIRNTAKQACFWSYRTISSVVPSILQKLTGYAEFGDIHLC
jgi:hypothetical protein